MQDIDIYSQLGLLRQIEAGYAAEQCAMDEDMITALSQLNITAIREHLEKTGFEAPLPTPGTGRVHDFMLVDGEACILGEGQIEAADLRGALAFAMLNLELEQAAGFSIDPAPIE